MAEQSIFKISNQDKKYKGTDYTDIIAKDKSTNNPFSFKLPKIYKMKTNDYNRILTIFPYNNKNKEFDDESVKFCDDINNICNKLKKELEETYLNSDINETIKKGLKKGITDPIVSSDYEMGIDQEGNIQTKIYEAQLKLMIKNNDSINDVIQFKGVKFSFDKANNKYNAYFTFY